VTRALRLPLAALLCLALWLPAAAAPRVHKAAAPAAGPGGPPSTVLVEVSSGQALSQSDAHRRVPPASLDKLMTFYLTLQAIRGHRISLDTPVTVSAEAWRIGRTPGSSRMFLNVGDVVTVRDLLGGLMVASGNDAAEALAEAVGGSGPQFVEMMNAQAARLGLHDTHYVTPHGLPSPGEYTSAWDVALLARLLLLEFPDAVEITRVKYETYARIRQANWNNLVFRDPRVDGLKTGHTDEAGFSIAATAVDQGMRLIAVVLGAPTLMRRTDLAEGLFADGFSQYSLKPVPWQQSVPASVAVYGGSAPAVALETAAPVSVLLRRNSRPTLSIAEAITARPFAPLARAQTLGTLTVDLNGHSLVKTPLLAADGVERASPLGQAWGYVQYAAGHVFHRGPMTYHGTYVPRE
jgi:D-alanyl-D-alanine carboxypeptidase (penicillin-binding protein 5/6)